MANEKGIPNGAVGLAVVILGVIGRVYLRWINVPSGGGGLEAASDMQMLVGGGSALLLLVGGIISLVGAAKGSGRSAGVIGIIVAVLFILLMFVRL